MPGIHCIIVPRGIENPVVESELNNALGEFPGNIFKIAQLPELYVSISAPFGYPWSSWETDEYLIVVDGLIYYPNVDTQEQQLSKIAEEYNNGSDSYKDRLRRFVKDADGDFIILIWAKNYRRLLIFNDQLARLAFYYYCDGKIAIFSRELRTQFRYIPSINLQRSSLVEMLLFQYPLGNKTLLKDLFRLEPCEIISVDDIDGYLDSRRDASLPFNFNLQQPIENPTQSINLLRKALLDSMRDRINTLERRNYGIIADLSGGFDTRAVLGGFYELSKSAQYFTQMLIPDDESEVAEAVFRTTHAAGSFDVVRADHNYDVRDLGPLIYKTDGLVNYYTTFICNADINALRRKVTGLAARFGGLGGEFIRHPTTQHIGSIFNSVLKGIYSRIPVSKACKIAKVKVSEYIEELHAYLDTYPETDTQDQLKRWYYEYYNHFVGAAAEDRERENFWTVHPMWSPRFLLIVFNRIPLNRIGYSFFVSFLKSLNPTLLKVPIYYKQLDLESSKSLRSFERYQSRKKNITQFIKVRASVLLLIYRHLSVLGNLAYRQSCNEQIAQYDNLRFQYPSAEFVYDSAEMKNHLSKVKAEWLIRQAGTTIIHVGELAARYKSKIKTK